MTMLHFLSRNGPCEEAALRQKGATDGWTGRLLLLFPCESWVIRHPELFPEPEE